MSLPIPSVSEIFDLLKKGLTIEAQEKIMNLRQAVIELQDENLMIKQENIKLKEELSVKDKLVWDGSVYWLGDERKEGPFCHHCYDTKKLMVHLQEDSKTWWCTSCKTDFEKKRP